MNGDNQQIKQHHNIHQHYKINKRHKRLKVNQGQRAQIKQILQLDLFMPHCMLGAFIAHKHCKNTVWCCLRVLETRKVPVNAIINLEYTIISHYLSSCSYLKLVECLKLTIEIKSPLKHVVRFMLKTRKNMYMFYIIIFSENIKY